MVAQKEMEPALGEGRFQIYLNWVARSEAVIFSNLKKVPITLRVMLPQEPKVFELRKSRGA